MSDLGWRADGIERAMAAGGVPLEVYRRPGFGGGKAVRRADAIGGGCGVPVYVDSEPYEDASRVGSDPLRMAYHTAWPRSRARRDRGSPN